MRTKARFSRVARRAGHYESFYIKAARPGGGLAAWIRHTVHKRPDSDPTGSIWLTVFDAEAEGPVATKLTVPAGELSVPEGGYIRIDGAGLAPGRASGRISTGEHSASWDLGFDDFGEPFHHLPYRFLYRAPLPRTKFLSPHPGARFSGTVTLGGEELDLDAWPGMIGHNWGSEHAERWVWIHGPTLDGRPGSFLDIAVGRIRVGPLTTPWVGNGILRLGGGEHRLGGFDRIRSTRIADRPASCSFEMAGKGVRVRGRVSAEPRNFVGWVYADPAGPEHNTLNCSISDLELEIERPGRGVERIDVPGAAAYEIGMRETDHGVPLEPYPDG